MGKDGSEEEEVTEEEEEGWIEGGGGKGEEKGREISPPRSFLKVGAYGNYTGRMDTRRLGGIATRNNFSLTRIGITIDTGGK